MSEEYISVHDELREISPLLASLPKRTESEIPADYFSKVEDQILSQLQLPFPKHNYPKAPDGYLENLEDQVIEKLTYSDKNQKSGLKVFRLVFSVAIAACLGVFLVSRFSWNDAPINDTNVANETVYYFDAFPHEIDDINVDQMIDKGLIEEEDLSFVNQEAHIEVEEQDPIFHSDAPF